MCFDEHFKIPNSQHCYKTRINLDMYVNFFPQNGLHNTEVNFSVNGFCTKVNHALPLGTRNASSSLRVPEELVPPLPNDCARSRVPSGFVTADSASSILLTNANIGQSANDVDGFVLRSILEIESEYGAHQAFNTVAAQASVQVSSRFSRAPKKEVLSLMTRDVFFP